MIHTAPVHWLLSLAVVACDIISLINTAEQTAATPDINQLLFNTSICAAGANKYQQK